MRKFILALGLIGSVAAAGAARPAAADPLRLHGTAAAARATGGHQKDEFGWGAGLFGAGELPLSRELGLQLELGWVWLSEGDPPPPEFAPEGDASAFLGGLGVRVRPFRSAYAGAPFSAAGLWVSAAGGVAQTGSDAVTGSRTRGMFDAFLGYDLLYDRGRFGIGPTAGYLHVFQSDDELRPADANVVLIGLHAMWDGAADELGASDRDKDGIEDAVDKCPDDPEDKDGFQDEDGCPELDNDGDGIPDTLDKCPMDPEDKDGFEDADGCPEADNDKDGLLDPKDKCPNDAEDKDGFQDEDGCPEKDNDQDGILDPDDLCPDEPETKNGYADHDGCPDEEQVRVLGDKIVLDDRVHFPTNSHVIQAASFPLLGRLAKLIKDHPEYVLVEIEGHADERKPEFNQQLSENRAKAVLEFLVSRGVERTRLTSKGFGSTVPLVDKSSEDAWLMNRRVEFRVTRQDARKGITPSAAPVDLGPVPKAGPSDVPKPDQAKPLPDKAKPKPGKEPPPPPKDPDPEPSGGG
jgi:outer membrane protein OmpA-like peptidoglycan-associated protein